MSEKYSKEIIEIIDEYVQGIIDKFKNLNVSDWPTSIRHEGTFLDPNNQNCCYGWCEVNIPIGNSVILPEGHNLSIQEVNDLVKARMKVLYWEKIGILDDYIS